MATRRGRQFIDPCGNIKFYVEGDNISPFIAIMVNNISITGEATTNTPPHFIARTLCRYGGIAYLREANEWARYVAVGKLDRFGLPKFIKLYGDGGRLSAPYEVDKTNVCIFGANSELYPPAEEIRRRVETIEAVGVNLAQNLDSLKSCTAIVYDDKDLEANISKAEEMRKAGAATVKIFRQAGQNLSIEKFGTDTQSHLQDYLAIYKQTMEEIDQLNGVASLGEKNERRINEEVAIIENAASATIDTVINSINMYAKFYNVDIKAERFGTYERKTPVGAKNEGIEAQEGEEQ